MVIAMHRFSISLLLIHEVATRTYYLMHFIPLQLHHISYMISLKLCGSSHSFGDTLHHHGASLSI